MTPAQLAALNKINESAHPREVVMGDSTYYVGGLSIMEEMSVRLACEMIRARLVSGIQDMDDISDMAVSMATRIRYKIKISKEIEEKLK